MAAVLLLPHFTQAISLDRFVMNPFDSTALMLAGIINNIAAVVGKLMLLIIEMIIVPILGYNGFSSADIVDLGWSLVRDVVNMAVVVILIVLAMQTIIGYHKANWTQQLPRLFIGVILVNFSRTICGVLIDISQVVMFTFVNAIIDIAAGNFAQMLGISQFGEFSNEFIDKINDSGTGIEAYAYLGSAYLQLALYLAIFGVILLMALMYIWRIVLLWLLIIMSPIAFFLNGLGDMFKASSSYYGKWWEKFSGALIMGPLLTFFLWLSLAASSGSNLAVTQDFPLPDEPGEYGLALENFSLDSLLGTFVALLLLIVGMQLASASAAAIGGPVSKYISEDMGKKLVTGAVKLPGSLANRAIGKSLDKSAAKYGGTQRGTLSSYLMADAGKMLNRNARRMDNVPLIGGMAAAGLAAGGGALLNKAGDKKAELRKAAAERAKKMNSGQRDELLASMAQEDGGQMFGAMAIEDQEAFHVNMATNLRTQKDAKKSLKDRAVLGVKTSKGFNDLPPDEQNKRIADAESKAVKDFEKVLGNSIQHVDKNKDDLLDSAGKDALAGTMTQNLHLLKAKGKPGDRDYKSQDDVIKEFVKDQQDKGGFKVRMLSEDAARHSGVQKALDSEMIIREGKPITLLEDIKRGTQGKPLQDAVGGVKKVSPVNAATFTIPEGAPPERKTEVANNVRNVVATSGVAGLDDPTLASFREAVNALPPDTISHGTRVGLDEQLMKKGNSVDDIYGVIPESDVPDDTLLRISDLMEREPTYAQAFESKLPAAGANDITEAIVDGVKVEGIKKLKKKFDDSTGEEKAKIRKSVEVIEKSVDAHLEQHRQLRASGMENDIDREFDKKLKSVKSAIKMLTERQRRQN